ncbi:MAG: 30S ribosomal protein S17 [Planctomycetes bacterium]|nr:30S ribosomal protein S17 [Planctomycetota bacterium]
MTEETTTDRGTRKELSGTVVSDKGDKTIIVEVERLTKHKLYRKTIRVRKKYYVHDENNVARMGDVVDIMGTRPISKKKCWRLLEVTKAAPID